MIKILRAAETDTENLITKKIQQNNEIEKLVDGIIADIRAGGDAALREYTERFDGVSLDSIEVTEEEMNEAFASTDEYFLRTLEMAKSNITEYHRKQCRQGFSLSREDGILLGQRVMPLARVGIYVPGGTAAYPSTVLMNAVPPSIAGVKEIIMTTPPGKDGKVPAAILAAAKIAGVTRIFKVGGAQAIAALAYGTESIPRTDKIVGPGNIYVATAKRRVYGTVDIDMIAGPSEILVIADDTCEPAYVAADMLSQAEHDRQSSSILVTDSAEIAEQVSRELEMQIPKLLRKDIARASIDDNGKIIVTEDIKAAIAISNVIAPEHLELCVDDPFMYLDLVTNAGSVFLGKNAPEALGDYWAGTNHTLPTSGTAKFSSPLSVDDFVKKSSYMYYTKEALGKVKDRIADFAEREGLQAHSRSVLIRFEDSFKDSVGDREKK